MSRRERFSPYEKEQAGLVFLSKNLGRLKTLKV